jgi:SAM-dependent methyltransferase
MSETIYDRNVEHYIGFIDRVLAMEPSLFRMLLGVLDDVVADRHVGATVLDLACGEGYVSRHYAERGAKQVTGVDLSSELVKIARERTSIANVSFEIDDAHELRTQADDSIDLVVSQMAMMDIADHRAAFRAVARVLEPGGMFAFTMLHPCFQPPFEMPDRPAFLDDSNGEHIAVLAWRYRTEGHWFSGGDGVRGTMGSNHRMLSTYVNDLVAAGFAIERIEEPVAPVEGLLGEVPILIVIGATRTS